VAASDSSNRICGVHAVYEALASRRLSIERIHIAREMHSAKVKQILELAREREIPVRKEDRVVLDRIAEGAIHQGIVAISAALSYADFEVLFQRENPLIIVLDGVEDPHNLGAVMRTAEACGASGIVVPDRHSAPLSMTVVKASAGASAYVPISRVKNLVNALDEMKKRGLWIVGVDPQEPRTGPVSITADRWPCSWWRTSRLATARSRALRRPCAPADVGKIASLNISVRG
jgi:23S rRNA (guanosine2251-2'-O)-methyltransferase